METKQTKNLFVLLKLQLHHLPTREQFIIMIWGHLDGIKKQVKKKKVMRWNRKQITECHMISHEPGIYYWNVSSLPSWWRKKMCWQCYQMCCYSSIVVINVCVCTVRYVHSAAKKQVKQVEEQGERQTTSKRKTRHAVTASARSD